MSVTINDIARQLNLSVGTVSKALNDYRDISESTRARVQEAAREMGYYPSASARNLRRRRTEKIGLVVNYPVNVVNDFLSELIPGAAGVTEEADYHLILYTRAAQHPEQISRICRAREVDGLLLLWPPQLEETVALMAEESMPYVVLPRRTSLGGVSYVAVDHFAGGRLLTEHLIELGHTRIGFTGRPNVFETNTDRLAGYRAALAAAGLPFDESLVIETDGRDPQNGEKALHQFLSMTRPPSALLCFTDPMAFQVISAAKEAGIRVPDDLSVAGHDGILISGLTVPALTTVRQPIPEIGRLAAETLLALIQHRDLPPVQHMLPVELVVRESTAPVYG